MRRKHVENGKVMLLFPEMCDGGEAAAKAVEEKPPFTLKQARALVEKHKDKGIICPCCDQMAKIYKRSINVGMACSLIKMLRVGGLDWQHIPTTVGGKSREEGKFVYWGLAEDSMEKREDGGRKGVWRVTQNGKDFIEGRITLQKWARVYNKKLIELFGKQVSIQDCLKNKFNYNELMNG